MKLNENNTIIIQLLIALLIVVAEGATDIFTPSLPAIKKYFDSTEKIIQWTVSINLIGISISSLFYGPLSDTVGRRKVMLFGGFIFLVGSICCGFAQSIFSLIFFRFIQGIGGGVAIVIGFAAIRDLFTGPMCSRVLSRIEMVVAISPGIAPVAGSYIARYLNWHFSFYFISILAFVTLLANYYFFYETIGENKKPFSFPYLISGYFVLLKNPRFWCFLLIQTLIFARVFAETVNLPFVYIEGYLWPVVYYGYFMLVAIVVYVIGTMINQRFVCEIGVEKMLSYGLILAVFTGLALVISAIFFRLNPLMIEIIKIPGAFALAFIFSNATTMILDIADEYFGTAIAIMSALQVFIGTAGSYLLAKYYNGTYLPIAILCLVCTFISICLFGFVKAWSRPLLNLPKNSH